MMRHELRTYAAVSATVLAMVLAGCGDGDDAADTEDAGSVTATATDASDPTDPTEPTATGTAGATGEPTAAEEATEPGRSPAGSTAPATTAGPDPVGTFGTDVVQTEDFPSAAGDIAYLTDVRVAGQDGFDRVVLEFAGDDVPSYRVSYVEPPITEDGSGQPVEVPGEAFLELRLTPASGVDLSGGEPQEIYTGPSRVSAPASGVVTEVVETGDFEATLGWVVGMEQQAPFAVSVLEDPLRLVVDIQHPADGSGGA